MRGPHLQANLLRRPVHLHRAIVGLRSAHMRHLVRADVRPAELQVLRQLQRRVLAKAPRTRRVVARRVRLQRAPGRRLAHRSAVPVLLALVPEREVALLVEHAVALRVGAAHAHPVGVQDGLVPALVHAGASHLVQLHRRPELLRRRHLLHHDLSPVLVARHEYDLLREPVVDGTLALLQQPRALLRHLPPALVARAHAGAALAHCRHAALEGATLAVVGTVAGRRRRLQVGGWQHLDARGDHLHRAGAGQLRVQPRPLVGAQHVRGRALAGAVRAEGRVAARPRVQGNDVHAWRAGVVRAREHGGRVHAPLLRGTLGLVTRVGSGDTEVGHELVLRSQRAGVVVSLVVGSVVVVVPGRHHGDLGLGHRPMRLVEDVIPRVIVGFALHIH
mmetsp:Transcript_26070/g.43971  ORF Transcript_26070/g.43971 Transcript_26070/m.43971 type:complete len:390 (+) Transcript_26070:372-1541(+)